MDEAPTPEPDTRRWVLIESGSNQEFLFQSTRRRFQVGASALLTDLAAWVADATAGEDVDTVVCTSSKALLLVGDSDVGRDIVRDVTQRALKVAPGLDVWGFVEQDDQAGEPMSRLGQLHTDHSSVRHTRPSPKLRFPMQPFLETCRITGLPAAGTIKEPRPKPGDQGTQATSEKRKRFAASATAAAVFARAGRQHKSLRDPEEGFGDAVLSDLSADVLNAGWVAVVHADGNRIGDVISRIETTAALSEFSKALQDATRGAFKDAVGSVTDRRNWLVPLIIGGDDVTFVCDGRVALRVVSAYLTAFETRTATGVLAEAARAATGQGHLTASAGIAFVKPHFPFHAAYQLASELADEAKTVKQEAPGRSAYDFHVLHDSVVRPLSQVRASMAAAGWAGPFLAAPGLPATTPPSDWEAAHAEAHLTAAVATLQGDRDERPLSGSALHDLRAALLAGGQEPGRTRTRVLAASRRPAAAEEFLAGLQFTEGKREVSRLLAVIDAADMAAGVLAGERGGPLPTATGKRPKPSSAGSRAKRPGKRRPAKPEEAHP